MGSEGPDYIVITIKHLKNENWYYILTTMANIPAFSPAFEL